MGIQRRLKKFIIKLIPKGIINEIINPYKIETEHGRLSYSQEGEDILLFIASEGILNGFYVDIGAHHPLRFSNTQYLYNLGWRGINIDAQEGSMGLFNKYRINDINLEIGISEKEEALTFYKFKEPAFNTFNQELAEKRIQSSHISFLEKTEVDTKSLKSVLDKHLPKDKSIDVLSVDVEGFELNILESNDWSKYMPKVIAIEDLDSNSIDELLESQIYKYLNNIGYKVVAKSRSTIIYKLSEI